MTVSDVELAAAERAYEFAQGRYDYEMDRVLPSAYRPEVIRRLGDEAAAAAHRLGKLKLARMAEEREKARRREELASER